MRCDWLVRLAAISLIFCCIKAHAGQAPPLISPKGIVSSASFGPPLLPGGAIAQGSIFAMFGFNMRPITDRKLSLFYKINPCEDVPADDHTLPDFGQAGIQPGRPVLWDSIWREQTAASHFTTL